MIEFSRSSGPAGENDLHMNVKVVGIGGAGSNVLDRIAVDGGEQNSLILLNTDERALTTSIAGAKIQLGKDLTMGLGCGGDPELGREAAMQATDEIRAVVHGCDMIFICVGLGGGTGSGAAPVVAKIAREQGAFVVVFTTMPFRFEGRRRLQQANMALSELKDSAHALLTFENDRMGELIVPKDGVRQAFAAADKTICQSIRAITSLVEQPGMIRIGMDDLLAVLKGKDSRCLFGFGQASGKDRVKVALRAALDNPLLDRGELLSEGANVLVHISGGENLKLAEVEAVMDHLGEHVDDSAQLLFGVSTSAALDESICVAVISSIDRERAAALKQAKEEAAQARLVEERTQRLAQEQAEAQAAAHAALPARELELELEIEDEPEIPSMMTVVPTASAAPEPAPAPAPIQEPVPAPAPRVEASIEVAPAPAPAPEPAPDPAPEPAPVVAAVAPAPEPIPVPEPIAPEPIELEPAPAPVHHHHRPTPVIPQTPAGVSPVAPVHAHVEQAHREPLPVVKPQVVKPSIFSVVDSSPHPAAAPTTPPAPGHPKVKIEFADEDDTPTGAEPGERTITLQPPSPSVASQAIEGQEPVAPSPNSGPKYQPASAQGFAYEDEDSDDEPEPAFAGAAAHANGNGNGAIKKKGPGQQLLDLEPASRGRFDKGEPTIVDGEDYDIPTFLRKKRRAG